MFSKYLDKVSTKNSKIIIKFLDNNQLKQILMKDKIITHQENFVKYNNKENEIKYYYSERHYKPIVEKVLDLNDVSIILGDKWKLNKYIKYDLKFIIGITEWKNYLNCFISILRYLIK